LHLLQLLDLAFFLAFLPKLLDELTLFECGLLFLPYSLLVLADAGMPGLLGVETD